VTLESCLPWVSVAAALGAGAAIGGPRPRIETGLTALALGALATFAYFKWIAPAAIPLALTLETIGVLATPPEPRRWRAAGLIFTIAGWVVLAQLFWSTGDGRLIFFTDAAKTGLLIALAAAGGWIGLRAWGGAPAERPGRLSTLAGLLAMDVCALTLDWGLWPALAGTAAVTLGQGLSLAEPGAEPQGPVLRRGRLALDYLGYAAIAYAFLR
jgi:hypothetical protein